jgi:dihydrofolate synthase/folylpolyglutamate synthase
VTFLEELAARRRLGMRPGLETIRSVCAALGNPQAAFPAVHVAGTNGKGAVCAIVAACLRAAGLRVARYTSPHLVSLTERFFLDGQPIEPSLLEEAAERVRRVAPEEMTFFEALTAVGFVLFAQKKVEAAVLETGLGGRLDATNICAPAVSVITHIGLDHCDWLGGTVPEIAREKAGIIKPGVPVVLGRNSREVQAVIQAEAARRGAPYFYAPACCPETEIPAQFSLSGKFNRENAQTALVTLQILSGRVPTEEGTVPTIRGPFAARLADWPRVLSGFAHVDWPGRFQRAGRFLVDGAHNPPAASALAAALAEQRVPPRSLTLIAGFCGDKEALEVLRLLSPFVARGIAVKTNNPRSLSAEAVKKLMESAGIEAKAEASLARAIAGAEAVSGTSGSVPTDALGSVPKNRGTVPTETLGSVPTITTLICGSLFLAGEALVALKAPPYHLPACPAAAPRFDPSELLRC